MFGKAGPAAKRLTDREEGTEYMDGTLGRDELVLDTRSISVAGRHGNE